MSKFRKKPVVIDAVQWTGGNANAIKAFTGVQADLDYTPTGEANLTIATLEGTMTAAKGDWIIKGIQGEFYPCKPDIFADSYEPVASPWPVDLEGHDLPPAASGSTNG